MIIINPYIAYQEKNGIYAIFFDYNFYFLEKETSGWFCALLQNKTTNIPNNFINWLKERNIVLEVEK